MGFEKICLPRKTVIPTFSISVVLVCIQALMLGSFSLIFNSFNFVLNDRKYKIWITEAKFLNINDFVSIERNLLILPDRVKTENLFSVCNGYYVSTVAIYWS